MLDELEEPSLEAHRDRSSLLLFHKIHSGAVSIEKDKYLTPAHSLKSTLASPNKPEQTKILKLAQTTVIKPITNIINLTVKQSQFPDDAKTAVVAPLHKKNSFLDKENFRPVSILPILSKLYEKAFKAQLSEYFNHHFDIFHSAFRTQYGCQSTLLRVIEDWKQALDQNKYVAAILMDLSKAFDCLPHDLLLLKLKIYGLSEMP